MASPLPNSKTQNPEKNLTSILSDLITGQDSARQLNKILSEIKGLNQEGKDLMVEVLSTFSKVISVLDTTTETSEVSNGKRKFDDDSDQKIARRKRARPESGRTIISNTVEDGQAWRKYGQKTILNSKNPRSYFRCTHKFDQGCKALKQVQTSDEDPSKFIISYIDKHTCKNPFSFMQPSTSLNNNSCLISFESNTNLNNTFNNINNQEGLMSPSFQSSKQEGGEEAEVLSNVTESNPTVARISNQVNPDQTGLNANSDMDRFDQSFDELEELLTLGDWGSFGFELLS